MKTQRKLLIGGIVVAIVTLALFAVASVLVPVLLGPGVKTEELSTSRAQAATTEVNGTWLVQPGSLPNYTSVGFTFEELLPSDRRTTSGSTRGVRGSIEVRDNKLLSGRIEVDMTSLSTDTERRDVSIKNRIFHTDKFPIASFEVTSETDLSEIPADGLTGEASVTGKLTIMGNSQTLTQPFTFLRSGDELIASATIPINRLDYGVETPEFVAAKIAEEGELNILINFTQQ